MFAAGLDFDLHRMPELFCGFPREPGESPVPYPVACAAGLGRGLGIPAATRLPGPEISAPQGHIHFNSPRLPSSLTELRIHNLRDGRNKRRSTPGPP